MRIQVSGYRNEGTDGILKLLFGNKYFIAGNACRVQSGADSSALYDRNIKTV
ncbi:MAG: hypothetical protein RRZ42_01445 [Oscillospiraceae bacterium]